MRSWRPFCWGWPGLMRSMAMPSTGSIRFSRQHQNLPISESVHDVDAVLLPVHPNEPPLLIERGYPHSQACKVGVRATVYSAADRVIHKAEALSTWLEAVLPAYEAAKRDPRLTLAVEPRKRSLSSA